MGRQLRGIIAARDPDAISQEAFDRGAAATQGLPVLERLLYGEEAVAALLAEDEEARFRCRMVVGIATNLEAMAADMRREWADGPDAFAATIRSEEHPSELPSLIRHSYA